MDKLPSHIPGPWTVDNRPGGALCYIRGSDGHVLARTVHHNGRVGDPTPEDHANALLIAAAPSLEDALRLALPLLHTFATSSGCACDAAIAAAEAALIAASGSKERRSSWAA